MEEQQQNGQTQQQAAAIQSFNEFTGSQDESEARRVLAMCDWDVQRAINIYFMRTNQADGEDEAVEVIATNAYDNHPPLVQRISHFTNKREEQQYGPLQPSRQIHNDSLQIVNEGGADNDIQMLDDEQQTHPRPNVDASSEEVRAPIQPVRGVMLAQSYQETYQNGRARTSNPFFQSTADDAFGQQQQAGSGPSSSSSSHFKQLQAAHRAAAEKHHQRRGQPSVDGHAMGGATNGNERPAAQGTTHALAGAEHLTGGFGQQQDRSRRDLRHLFRPPVDMIFYGHWDQARQAACQKNVWLLVNVQDANDFPSAVLNRDIWSAEAVKEIIQSNFLFLQIYHDSADGVRLRGYYGFTTYPVIFIVDPRTGEEVTKLQAVDPVTFLDNLTTFLSRYPTFEARDREFRELATQGRMLPSTSAIPGIQEQEHNRLQQQQSTSNNNTSHHQSIDEEMDAARSRVMTSPIGKKRKQSDRMDRGGSSSGGEEFDDRERASAEESVRIEANRQAKKMKRVVTISDQQLPSTSASTSSTSTFWSPSCSSSMAAAAPPKIGADEWQKWTVAENSTQIGMMKRILLQLRLPDGQRQRYQFWAETPLAALFSLIASFGLDPAEYQLVLDFPRREFQSNNVALLNVSLGMLDFGCQEMVNVEKRAQ